LIEAAFRLGRHVYVGSRNGRRFRRSIVELGFELGKERVEVVAAIHGTLADGHLITGHRVGALVGASAEEGTSDKRVASRNCTDRNNILVIEARSRTPALAGHPASRRHVQVFENAPVNVFCLPDVTICGPPRTTT
jgi:hypothetical protein